MRKCSILSEALAVYIDFISPYRGLHMDKDGQTHLKKLRAGFQDISP